MIMRNSQQHLFAQVPGPDLQRSTFDRSHTVKTTFDEGYLIPFYVDEALPGDTFNCKVTAFARLATLVKPIMDNLYIDTFFFSVPNRLLWSNWKKFMGEQINPGDSTSFTVPQMVSPAGGYLNSTLHDYLGLPTQVAGITHSALWTRAYYLIYNEWFRDENLQNSLTVDTGDGPDTPANYSLQRRGKRKDYFTSALPWPQKGPSVPLPLGTVAPVRTSSTATVTGAQSYLKYSTSADGGTIPAGDFALGIRNGGAMSAGTIANGSYNIYPNNLFADLTGATASTINQLRQAFQIQRLYERDARGGTRYIEILKSHFGVTSSDARLQRPEYLGGGTSMINVHPIAQVSATSTTPQGNLAAFGTATVHGHGFHKSFEEHTTLIGLCSVRADMTYQQGLNKMWQRLTRFDYYFPSLAHLGEQAILNDEIFAQGNSSDDLVFGYQERYADYRYKPSQITGKFRSNYSTPLDVWHLSQSFSSLPALNSTFIVEAPPLSRALVVPSEPHLLMDAFIQLRCTRPMPVYSVPGLIDHF